MNAKDHFSGDWKLNLRKSQFAPGHHPTNGIMHWEQTAEGYRMTAQKTGDNGQIVEERPLNVILDGKEHLIPDLPGWSAMMSQPTPNCIEAESKHIDRRSGNASYVVSADGTTMTANVSGFDAQQRSFQTVLVWDRL
jgi:hypothetical protein